MRLVLLLLASMMLFGCAVGPDYVPPSPDTPEAWVGPQEPVEEAAAEEPLPEVTREPIQADWWASLGDERLTSLVRRAVQANLDVAQALLRVREARALKRVATAPFFPSIGGEASYSRSKASGQDPTGPAGLAEADVTDLEVDIFQAGFDAVWELDFFGGVRRSRERAGAEVDATVAELHDVLTSVAAETASTYAEVRGAQLRLAVALRNIRIQGETTELVETLFSTGLAPELDLRRARAELASLRATVPRLRADVRRGAHRLAVLLGQPPGTLLQELLTDEPLPHPPDVVPVGLPSELLARRPDIRRAERLLHASTAGIGVAKAELFPKFFLTGAVAQRSGTFADFFQDATTWTVGPLMNWRIFEGRRLRAEVDAAKTRAEIAELTFRQTLLTALEEVESALVDYAQEELARRRLAESVTDSRLSLDLANVRYKTGLGSFLDVLDAERTLAQADDALAVSETRLVVNLVRLYKALGGGWQVLAQETGEAREEEG